jgi:hypothetical protein
MKNNINSHYMSYIYIFYHYIFKTLLLYKHYKPMEILRIFCENSKYQVIECQWGINHKTTVV